MFNFIYIIILIFINTIFLTAQDFKSAENISAASMAAGATDDFEKLYNKPRLVTKPVALPVEGERGWIKLTTDAHVFTDIPFENIAAVLDDIPNYTQYLSGKKQKIKKSVVTGNSKTSIIADFIAATVVGPFDFDTSYTLVITDKSANKGIKTLELVQLDNDNEDMRNHFGIRYAQSTIVAGEEFCYVRFYTVQEIDKGIVPASWISSGSEDIVLEALQLLLNAARKKQLQ